MTTLVLRLAAAGLLCLAAGCGPGVGGTGGGGSGSGFGPDGGPPLCSQPFAPLLDCRADGGTGPVFFADTATPATALLQLQDQRAMLAAACAGLAFDGTWSGSRFTGVLQVAGTAQPGTLDVAAAGTTLELRLRDAAGALRLGPVQVQRFPRLPAGC